MHLLRILLRLCAVDSITRIAKLKAQGVKPNLPEPQCGSSYRSTIEKHEHSIAFFCCLNYGLCGHYAKAWKALRKQVLNGEELVLNRDNNTADLSWLKLNCENRCELDEETGLAKQEILPVIHLYRKEVSSYEPYSWTSLPVDEIRLWGKVYWKNQTEKIKGQMEENHKKTLSTISRFVKHWTQKHENKYFLKVLFWVNRIITLTSKIKFPHEHLTATSMLMPSTGMHAFFYVFLAKEVHNQQDSKGLSAWSVLMQALPACLRVCFFHRYDMNHASDLNNIALVTDAYTCLMLLNFLYVITWVCKGTYQREHDNCSVLWLVYFCVLGAVLFHTDVGESHLSNVAWTAALYIEIVAMIPQLWMLRRCGGLDQGVANEVVGVGVVSRLVNLILLARYFYIDSRILDTLGFPWFVIGLLCIIEVLVLCELIDFVEYSN